MSEQPELIFFFSSPKIDPPYTDFRSSIIAPKDKPMNERDTHFQGFAKLQMPVLDSLFILLYQAYAQGDTAKRDEYSQRIQTFLAQCAYDLVGYVLGNEEFQWYELEELHVEDIPDLTEWPERSKQ